MAEFGSIQTPIGGFTSLPARGAVNCFGSVARRFPLVDPRSIRSDRVRFRRDALPLLERANSFYCPAGRWPSRGWVLLPRGEYDLLTKTSTALQLDIGDTTLPNNVRPLRNLSIVQAQCVTTGVAADPAAIYLIEITDARGVLHNEWMQFPIYRAYNIRVPSYPETFYLETMKDYAFPPGAGSKTTWTWSTMLQSIWETMPLLGTWPGLPTPVPTGTPEGFWLIGVPAWTALCDILDTLGLVVACNLTSTTPFTIVRRGATDVVFRALQLFYDNIPDAGLEDDQEWIDVGAGRAPRYVKVFFRRRNRVYGSEETTPYRNDAMADQWVTFPGYTVTVDAPAIFAGAAGTHHIWSDFTVRSDDSGVPLPADVATANTIAAERVLQYFGKIYSQTLGYMSRTWAGALPFTTGSEVDGVCYYQDYRNGDYLSWRTKIVRGPNPPFPEICR